ncbi:MAG: hypothetical protein WBB67_12125 [bacterium]
MKSLNTGSEKLKSKGYFNAVNPKPAGNYILIFASDWNKDYWAFYAYVSQQEWREDIKQINDLIKRMNWRDSDVYVEMIDYHDKTMHDFYMYLYDSGYLAHWSALDIEKWESHCP